MRTTIRSLSCLCLCFVAGILCVPCAYADDAMVTTEFIAKCKRDAAFCRDMIVKGSDAPIEAGEACIPGNVTDADMMKQVLHLWELAESSGTDLSKDKYSDDIYDAVATLWPCRKP